MSPALRRYDREIEHYSVKQRQHTMASTEAEDLADHLLVKNRVRLVDELNVHSILDDLRQAKIINAEDEERILNGETGKDKVRKLLKKLEQLKHHPQAIWEFLNSIKKHQPLLHGFLLSGPQTGLSIQQRLKEKYAQKKALCMKHPWATERLSYLPHDLYTNLKLINHKESTLHRDAFSDYSSFQEFCREALQAVHYKDLFKDGIAGRRVLIEGDPGIGKTTLCYKLIHDYSKSDVAEGDRYYVHDLLFAFVIEVRHFRGSIRETLKRSLSLSESEMDELWRMIQANPGKCLFLLDGLDESTRQFPEEIRDLIEGRLFGDCLLLATCRSNQANAYAGFFNTEVVNVGFLTEQAFEYVQKYILHSQAAATDISMEKVIHFLETEAEMLGDLLQTPLNCLLLCLWLEEWMKSSSQNHPLVQGKHMTTTGFYEMVVRSITKRYCEKKNLPLTRGKIPVNLKEDLIKLERLALFGVLKERYKFTVDDLNRHQIDENDEVLTIGFLSREYSVSMLEEEDDVSYSFPHRSIQDFFAAKAVQSMPEAFKRQLLVFFGRQWKIYEHICLFLFGTEKEDFLLKWLLCCTLASSPYEEVDNNAWEPFMLHVSSTRRQYEKNISTIHAVFQEAKRQIASLQSVPEPNQDSQSSISVDQIKDCVDHYKPAYWIWTKTETGKLSDTLCHCLRWMYEVGFSERPTDASLISRMVSYLLVLSNQKGPDWDVINGCSPEIQTLIVRLWIQKNCSSSLKSQRCFQIQVGGIRDKVWSMLFKMDGLLIQDLELSYSSSEHILHLIENLGPQADNLKKLSLNCSSQIVWQQGQYDEMLRKEILHRKALKTQIGQLASMKSILLSSRELSSCIGFLPENLPLEEVTIMALHWPQHETQELIQEALLCQVKKMTLHQRCGTTVTSTGYVLQALQHMNSSANKWLKEVHIQGFQLTWKEEELLSKLQQHLKSKNINLRLTECQLMVQSVETVDQLLRHLNVNNPRECLIARRILNLDKGVFSNVDGCMALFEKSGQLDWSRIGDKLVTKLLQAGLKSMVVQPRCEVDGSEFQRYILPAIEKTKPKKKVELLFSKQPSKYEMQSAKDAVEIRGGNIGWDHKNRRAFLSFTEDLAEKYPDLSKSPFPEG